MRTTVPFLILAAHVLLAASATAASGGLFARSNLVAWCIVPFDAKKRNPEERAQMLERLEITHFAYDWRAEHVPTFDAELDACQKHHIEVTAWWFPTSLDADARTILSLLERRRIRTQLWVMGGGEPVHSDVEKQKRVEQEVARLRPIAQAAGRIGCSVGLYNHGGWFGEPENQIAIIQALKMTNVGIVYNFHHAHDQMARFPEVFPKIQPYLLVVNINGMIKDADKHGQKILRVGAGDQELSMLELIRDSGWRGPIGILNHRGETDSEETLRENLRGLDELAQRLDK